MSDIDDNTTATELFDLTTGMDFDVTVEDVQEITSALEEAEGIDTQDEGANWLAAWAEALKALEDAAEDARDVFEAELKKRVDDGDTVGNLRRTPGTNRYVTDHEAAFDAVLDAGKDPRDVAKVSAPKLEDAIGDEADEYIGESSYSYFRRTQ